jgi:isocitrate dehydrogenase kinase/phosphatase
MRDIRNDLQERAELVQDRIKAADVHFDRMVEQLRNEHDASVADLKVSLAMIAKLMEFEERHVANTSPDSTSSPSSQHANLAQKLRRVI